MPLNGHELSPVHSQSITVPLPPSSTNKKLEVHNCDTFLNVTPGISHNEYILILRMRATLKGDLMLVLGHLPINFLLKISNKARFGALEFPCNC